MNYCHFPVCNHLQDVNLLTVPAILGMFNYVLNCFMTSACTTVRNLFYMTYLFGEGQPKQICIAFSEEHNRSP